MSEIYWFFAGFGCGALFLFGSLLALGRWLRQSKSPSSPSPQENPPAPAESAVKKKKHRTMWG